MSFHYRNRRVTSIFCLFALLFATTATPAAAEYDPRTGRFLQPDQRGMGVVLQPSLPYHAANPTVTVWKAYELQYGDGMNFYEYLRSNPPCNLDPSGEATLLGILARTGIYGALGGAAFGWMRSYATFSDYDADDPKGSYTALATAAFKGAGWGGGAALGMGLLAGAIAAGGTISLGTAAVSVGMMFSPPMFGVAMYHRSQAETEAEELVTNIELVGAGLGLLASHMGMFLPESSTALPRVRISKSRWPEAAAHIQDAQRAGHPKVLTVDRGGAMARRAAAQRGVLKVRGKDLDEYPPAMFIEGGEGASVRPIDFRQNRAVGASISQQLRGVPDGAKAVIEVEP